MGAKLEKVRQEAHNMRVKTNELKTSAANRAKELVTYENQQRITLQALDREASQISKEQKSVEIIQ